MKRATRQQKASKQALAAVLRGPRVEVRRATARDRAAFLKLVKESAEHLRPWEPRWSDPSGRLRFERLLASRRAADAWKGLIVRRSDGALLGQANVNNIVRGVAQSASVGYWLGKDHLRQGYMTEALGLVLRFAFGRLGLHRLECNMMPRNRRSRAVAKRLGFRAEGRSRGFLAIAGRWETHLRFALLAPEWRARRRASRSAR